MPDATCGDHTLAQAVPLINRKGAIADGTEQVHQSLPMAGSAGEPDEKEKIPAAVQISDFPVREHRAFSGTLGPAIERRS